jgi:hypothetical protein
MAELFRGIVASDPDEDELVDVVIPSFDAKQRFTDCVYMPRGEEAPSSGATCLVAFDDIGAAWVVAWQ